MVGFVITGTVVQMGVGDDHTCVLIANKVWCWGDGQNGILGSGQLSRSALPVAVAGLPGESQ